MIYVIGISYSVEFAIKGLYENTIGRITEWVRGETPTPEDHMRAKCRRTMRRSSTRCRGTSFRSAKNSPRCLRSGATPSHLRTFERKFAFSADYGVKIGYAWLIASGLDASSDAEERNLLGPRAFPADVLAKEPRIKPCARSAPNAADPHAALQGVRRYPASLLDRGIAVAEIAGNREIFITVVAPKDASSRARRHGTVLARSRRAAGLPPRRPVRKSAASSRSAAI